jgi:hypothetical protein
LGQPPRDREAYNARADDDALNSVHSRFGSRIVCYFDVADVAATA